MPWVIISQTIPILAVAPIVIVALGSIGLTGLVPKAIISAYLCFFPVAIGMVKGLLSPDTMQLDLMRTYNGSVAQTFWKLRWPAAVPFLFASLKVAITISLAGAQAGLGARLLSGSYFGQTIQIWSALLFAALLAAFLVVAVTLAERLTLKAMGSRP
jgi:NitT/TauT family transport system permease protein